MLCMKYSLREHYKIFSKNISVVISTSSLVQPL